MEQKELTAADIWAMFAETTRRMQETDRQMRETDLQVKETMKGLDKLEKLYGDLGIKIDRQISETNRQMRETDLKMQETDRQISETNRQMRETDLKMQETDRQISETNRQMRETDLQVKETMKGLDKLEKLYEDLGIRVKDVNTRVEGIGSSNGKFAEEYFYNSLEKKMEFAGVHFDSIGNKFGYMKKLPDGKRLEDQFDIVMINDNAVALIEVKYSADSDYPQKMVEKKIPNFKTLFPDYADYKIYLGIGSLSFDDYVVSKAKEYGIGLLRQVGETIECQADWVRAY